ncbi:protein-arginine deiminase domain-containing protein [Streptomyces sp. NPDC006798]|uniref:protein-arginine deiminase domain-containing protein n=1 Tax=Streptomyces sp. NPDC006798 TaxID=3155462 RepID=UPI0033F761D8
MRIIHRRRTALVVSAATVLLTTGTVSAPVHAAGPPTADLRADVDRDGTVDLTGTTDTAGEDSWTTARGAVFLPNLDDDTKRCRATSPLGQPLSDSRLASCNDAQDAVVNGAADEADLARLRTVPLPEPASNATGRVEVVSGTSKTRLHIKRNGKWSLVLPGQKLTAAELRAGVELGIEGRDIIRDRAVWDGRAVVRLTVTADGRTSSDDVTLRVAPLLTHHHAQRAQEVLVTKSKGTDPGARAQQKFVADLTEHAKAANLPAPRTFSGGEFGDVWAQDFFEPGYVGMTGPDGKRQTIRIMIRSVQEWRDAGREVFTKLRGPGIGGVQLAYGTDSGGTLDSMGNLETIPPHAHNGKSYPAGRIIQGQFPATGEKPAKSLRNMLASQGMQDPLLLDTGWLHVGHVDEFVQFLPADTPRGWRMAVADPEGGLKLLKDAKAAGHGAKRLFSRPAGEFPVPKDTIDQTLASAQHREDNALAARKIAENVAILKRETGITDAEIVKVPALYSRASKWPGVSAADSPRLARTGAPDAFMDILGKAPKKSGTASGRSAAAAPEPTSAWIPGAINGLLLGNDRYLAPKQWGPVVDGKDIFTEAVTAAYEKAGMKVSYIDDYYPYHLGSGEVHCGTNTFRDSSAAWWPTS